jgi:hypothetical protein
MNLKNEIKILDRSGIEYDAIHDDDDNVDPKLMLSFLYGSVGAVVEELKQLQSYLKT